MSAEDATIDEMPAGRDMDIAVASEVLGAWWVWCYLGPGPGDRTRWLTLGNDSGSYSVADGTEQHTMGPDDSITAAGFSTKIGAAWRVVVKMFGDGYVCHTFGCKYTTDAPWAATFAKGPNSYHASGPTVELAICRAAIKAKRAATRQPGAPA